MTNSGPYRTAEPPVGPSPIVVYRNIIVNTESNQSFRKDSLTSWGIDKNIFTPSGLKAILWLKFSGRSNSEYVCAKSETEAEHWWDQLNNDMEKLLPSDSDLCSVKQDGAMERLRLQRKT
jgi:hypothetical protein